MLELRNGSFIKITRKDGEDVTININMIVAIEPRTCYSKPTVEIICRGGHSYETEELYGLRGIGLL